MTIPVYTFPDEPVRPTKPLIFDDSEYTLSRADEMTSDIAAFYKVFIEPALIWAFRPVRALRLAYRFVLRGQKVEKAIEWSSI